MENLKRITTRIAATPDHRTPALPFFPHRCLLPLLSAASSLFRLSLHFRRSLYLSGFLTTHRLPVPVISVGNITWGGNGKTPMVEFISRFLDESGISPLILTRGYGGGDEAKMLKRHFSGTKVKIGVGPNRADVARSLISKCGYTNPYKLLLNGEKNKSKFGTEKIGAIILDDGMQHLSMAREIEVVMVNGLLPCGNGNLIPRGPLREPFNAINLADIVLIHNANLVSEEKLKELEERILGICGKSILIFFSKLVPSYIFEVRDQNAKLPLSILNDFVVFCVSSIGCPNTFFTAVKKIGAVHIERHDFSDHYTIQIDDIKMIQNKVKNLTLAYNNKTAIVLTEKDYDRDPNILKEFSEIKNQKLMLYLE
ncbi:hypothetical protein LUZ60_005473 [Juncus effusus]|nr:hypothetical protein LUZ60_005473 [Juncus effusus]